LTVLRLSCLLVCLLVIGCDPLWNAANRAGLESDMRALLKTAAVEPQHLQCRMVGSTRNASCSLRMSPSETASVIRTFALESIHTSSDPSSPLAWLIAHAGPSCVAGVSAPLATFGLTGRPNALRLPSGAAFEYLLLTINESTGQACVQVSYSSG
jgi:hypothetical protein